MDFSVIVLGSGAAAPTNLRNCSSQIVKISGKRLLVDCGESTQNQLRHAHQNIQSINTVFLSHLHGDHFFGLPGLLSTMHLCGRNKALTVFAPKGAKEAIELLLTISKSELQYSLNFEELTMDEPTVVYQEKNFHVTAFPLRHTVPTYGYLFEEETPLLNIKPQIISKYVLTNQQCVQIKHGEDLTLDDGTVVPNAELTLPRRKPHRYAYCCDTAYDETLIPIIQGVDMLCMESTYDSSFASLAEQRCHCTAAQAATIAAKAEVGRLLLTHFSARYREVDVILQEASAIFPNTVCAEDGMMYDV